MAKAELGEKAFDELVIKALEGAINEAAEAEIEKAKERVEQLIRKKMASLVMVIFSNYNIQRMGQDIVIRVSVPEELK